MSIRWLLVTALLMPTTSDAQCRVWRIADLPVLAKLGPERMGLLGGDLLSRLAVLEVDFVAERLRLWQ